MQESRFFFCINLFEIRNQYLLEDIAKYGKSNILAEEYFEKGIQEENIFIFQKQGDNRTYFLL